jgi:ubiquinone/menaquinone biosynthesis C-methylase UbiE
VYVARLLDADGRVACEPGDVFVRWGLQPVSRHPDSVHQVGGGETVEQAASTEDPNAVYSLGSSVGETERLKRQADELALESAELLSRVGLAPGQNAIDLGCGPRGVLDLLIERVSPGGTVVGVDADPAHVELAAAFAKEVARGRDLREVQVIVGDARATGLPSDAFDVVHARTLLVNIPQPADVVAEMVRLARPGGWVVVLEPDTEYAMCYPPDPAFDRISELFGAAFERNAADARIGRRVPELFRQAGLLEVSVEAKVQAYPAGHSRRTIRLDLLRAMRTQVVGLKLATEVELDELDTQARAHLANPDTLVIFGHMFLTWGLKPDQTHP